MDDTHAVLNAVFHPERHPHRAQGRKEVPVVPIQERVAGGLGMAHDTHGVLPQDMALFHLFQDIRRNTDRNAVIGRFRYAFPAYRRSTSVRSAARPARRAESPLPFAVAAA